MSGYFSRLIEQSGIPVRPAAGPAPALPARPPAPIDLEAQVEPRGEEPIFETRKGPETTSEVPGRIVEEPAPPAERVLHRETPEPPDRRSPGRRRSETSEGGAPDPRASERISPRRAGDAAGDLPARVDAVEAHKGAEKPVSYIREVHKRDETVEGATHRADERSPTDIGASGEAQASEPREEPQDRGGRELVWQSAFEEVRGWVAEAPVADDGRAQDVSRAVTSVAAPFVEERGATTRPGPVVTSPREEPETRDLRLEIGTVSVTVEEPRGEIPGTNRRVEAPERKPAGSGERSRLSRHYVRAR